MSKVAKTTVMIMALTIFSKVLGLVREQVFAAIYGAGIYSDAYVTAMKIPTVLFTVIGTAISTSLIPLYSRISKSDGDDKANEFLNNLINLVSLLSLGIVILGVVFTESLVKLFAVGFEGEKLRITIKFVRIILWGIMFIGINNMMKAFLQLKDNFKVPELMGIPYNVIIIAAMIISVKTNVYVLIVGSLLALMSQALLQYPSARKAGFKYKLKVNFKDENVKTLILLIMPVLVGVGVEQVNTLIDGTLASTFGDGVVSSFNYANRLYGFVSAIFVASILSVIYPIMSKSMASDDEEGFKTALKKTINSITLFLIPISVGTVVLAYPIVRVLFERGKFTPVDTIVTGNILIVYIIGVIAWSLRNTMTRAFYSLQDTKTPMVNGCISIGFNIVLNLILSKYLGYIGLAIASTISAYIGLVLFYFTLKKRVGNFGGKEIASTSIKTIVAAVIMGFVTKFAYDKLAIIVGGGTLGEIISVGTSIIIGALIYGIMILLLKVEESKIIIDMVKSKIKRK